MANPRKPKAFKLSDISDASKNSDEVKPEVTKPQASKPQSAVTTKPAASQKTTIEEPPQPSRKPAKAPRKPKAIKEVETLTTLPDDAAQVRSVEIEDLEPIENTIGSASGWTWGRLFWWAFTALLTLGLGLWLDQLVRDLFARNTWLGWVGLSITALFILAVLGLAIREISAILRLRSIASLRREAIDAHESPDLETANSIKRQVEALLSDRPRIATTIASLNEDLSNSVDGRDVLEMTERYLLAPLDKEATSLILAASKRVSVVTAISPRALADIAYVLYENLHLISKLSALYGGRTGTIGFFRLAKNVLAHLAATGAIAVGDGLVQQIIGQGLSARLSARLGEGVVNGLLTARIGISAMDICRPMPFKAQELPGIRDFLSKLGSLD